jgi:predicted dehydrogenase
MKAQLNWGIIGAGKIAHKFAQDMRLVPNARLHAIASSDRSRAQDFARQYGAEYAFGSYEAIVNCPHLDVVYIASTNEKHCENAISCLKRRIPVLCEKPLAMNLKEVERMLATADKYQTFFMEAMWSRFNPAFQKVLDIVEKGILGGPLSIKAEFGFFHPFDPNSRLFDIKQGGGSLVDIGVYPMTLAQSIFGKPLVINALAQMNKTTGVDDTCALQFGYANQEIALLNTSVTAALPIEAYIFCEKGYIHIPPRFHHPHFFDIYTYDGFKEPKKETIKMPYEGNGYQFEIMEVHHCLNKNLLESPTMPHTFSRDLMATLDAVREKIGLVYAGHD